MSRYKFDKVLINQVKDILNQVLDMKKSVSRGAMDIVDLFDEIDNTTDKEDDKK